MKSGGSPGMAEALRQQLAKAGRQAMAIHQGRDLGTQGLCTHRRKRKPAREEKQQLSESDGLTKKKKKKNESDSEEKNEREREKERKRRQKGKDKMTESDEEREREKEKKRRERQAEKEREEEQEMAMMLALAVPDVESDPASDRASPQPAPACEVEASAQKRPIEAEQAPLTREAELERRLKEDHDMIQRLKQELDQARAAAEAARRVASEEPEAQVVQQAEVDGGAAMPMEWATEVLMESDIPSITDLVNQPELISDFLSMADPPPIPPTTALPPSNPSPSSSSSSSLHASPIPGAANPAFGVWPAPSQATATLATPIRPDRRSPPPAPLFRPARPAPTAWRR